jgi:thymidylate synthase (FAD)
MEVSVLQATPNADRNIAACARGDYREDSLVGIDLSNDEDMSRVIDKVAIDHDYTHLDAVTSEVDEKVANMIHKLINRGHWGAAEHSSLTFAVEGISRSCMAQITRHRHVSFDVQSMRYVNVEDAEVLEPDTFDDTDVSMDIEADNAFSTYKHLLDQDVPKEDARMVLPIGTKVNLTMTMNLRTLAHIQNLRAKANSQWEIRKLTNKIIDEAKKCAPITIECIEKQLPMPISP